MAIKHILFDLDGTLTDSKLGITRCVQYALKSLGIDEPASCKGIFEERRGNGSKRIHWCSMERL